MAKNCPLFGRQRIGENGKHFGSLGAQGRVASGGTKIAKGASKLRKAVDRGEGTDKKNDAGSTIRRWAGRKQRGNCRRCAGNTRIEKNLRKRREKSQRFGECKSDSAAGRDGSDCCAIGSRQKHSAACAGCARHAN